MTRPLHVMTFNLKFASDDGPNTWPDRRPLLTGLLNRRLPDLIGTQEGLFHQIKDILVDCPSYDWIGLGREGGSNGEFMAIFFRRERLEPLQYDHFWLSDTPNTIASRTWDNPNVRMVTWAMFRDRSTNRAFYVFNTHFDHQIAAARQKSAHLVIQRVDRLQTDHPVLLVGDFNAPAGNSEAYDILVGNQCFVDTWLAAEERLGDGLSTYHGFGTRLGINNERIDWILARGEALVHKAEIVADHQNGQYPSDHFPVAAWITL